MNYGDVPCYVFDDMATTDARSLTGYKSEFLAAMYNKYKLSFKGSNREPTPRWKGDRCGKRWSKKVQYFFLLFIYIHIHPTTPQMPHVLRLAGQDKGVSSSTFYECVISIALELACALDEIHYTDRLDTYNHSPLFPVGVVGSIDTFPIYVVNAKDSFMSGLLYQPKYKANVYKVQIAVTLTGIIFFATFLHNGSRSDCRIFNETWPLHKMYRWEYWLADRIYNSCQRLLAGHKAPDGGSLTSIQLEDNAIISYDRSTVERVIKQVVDHGLFKERPGYAGKYEHLKAFVAITLHMTSALIKAEPSRQRNGFGPWTHDW